jgi:hypothetical protein
VTSVFSFLGLMVSALRDCRSSRSRTGVDGASLRLPKGLVTDGGETADVPLRKPGMPLFSARLLAMDDCGSLRRESARAGGEVDGEGDKALAEALPAGGEIVLGSVESSAAPLFFSFLREGSLIRRASLWWWSSRRARIRRAYAMRQTYPVLLGIPRNAAHLVVVCVLGGIVEGRCSKLVFSAGHGDAVSVRRRRGISDMLVSFVERCGLHGRCRVRRASVFECV